MSRSIEKINGCRFASFPPAFITMLLPENPSCTIKRAITTQKKVDMSVLQFAVHVCDRGYTV